MTDPSPIRLDPDPWLAEFEAWGWNTPEFVMDQRQELLAQLVDTPEFKGWTLEAIFAAWSAYSEFMLCSWLNAPSRRSEEFLRYLLIRQESGAPADLTLRESDDWWAKVRHLKLSPSAAERPVPTSIALDGTETFEELRGLVLARPANAPFTFSFPKGKIPVSLVQLALLLAHQRGRERNLSPAEVALQQAEYELALLGQHHRVQRVPPTTAGQEPPSVDVSDLPQWQDFKGICEALESKGAVTELVELRATSDALDLAFDGADAKKALRNFAAAKIAAYRLLGGTVPAQVDALMAASEGESA